MTKRLSTILLSTLVLASAAGCGTSEKTQETRFGFHGSTLEIVNPNHAMPVSVAGRASGTVGVSVTTTSVLKEVVTPAWSLDGSTLQLGSPCTKGYVGVCEGSYHVDVPKGTVVTVNGEEVAVR